MRAFKNDVSDFITPKLDPARLVVTISSHQSSSVNFDVTAEVDGETPLTGQFVIDPQWQAQAQGRSASRAYLADPLRDVGAQLFSALFSGSLSRVWAQTVDRARVKGGLHIVIRSKSLEVQSLPWELLSDTTLLSSEHVAIAEGWSVLRDVRMPNVDDPFRGTTLTPRADIKVAALTTPIPGVDPETDIRILNEAFGDEAVTADRNADRGAVLGRLASGSTHIVHIMANGRRGRDFMQDLVLDVELPDKMAVVKGQEVVAAAAMGAVDKENLLELVVLAACETDQLSAHLASVVPAVIGIRGTISNEGCETFLQGLYRALASGSTLTQAVAAGRLQQVGFSQSLGDDWAQPVLYLSADSPLVVPTVVGASVPEPAILAPTASREERSAQLRVEIKQANLRALKDQWGRAESKDIPIVVAQQIDSLDREVHGLTGGSS